MILLDQSILSKVITPRLDNTHKGDYGRVLLIGGNERYGGAISLAGLGCLYSGAGLTYVATNKCNFSSIHSHALEIMLLDIENTQDIVELLPSIDVIVIGCGLGLDKLNLLELILPHSKDKKIIIDGDGITLFSQCHLNNINPSNIIFTPHQKELERLTGIKIEVQSNDLIQDYVNKNGYTIVAKSHSTRIFSKDKDIYYLNIGKPSQATGGMGDTLAGMIGGFLGQFKSYDSILAATFLHSYIASILDESNYVVLPSMIIKEIPLYMKKCLLK